MVLASPPANFSHRRPGHKTCAVVLVFAFALLGGCGTPTNAPTANSSPASVLPAGEPSADPVVESSLERSEVRPLVVFLGDSLTAGYGLDVDQAFPALIESRLRDLDRPVRVINAGVSGDTSAGGLARLDWLLSQQPDLVVVCLGGNDGLRGLNVEQLEANLRGIVERSRQRGARVALAAMRLPPSYGETYVTAFEGLYPRLAAELDAPLIPFLLDSVAGVETLLLPDGLHPNSAGQQQVATNVLPHLLPILDAIAGEAPGPTRDS